MQQGMDDKATLRRLYAREREAVPSRAEAEKALRDNLFSLPAWRKARLVCGFLSVKSEPDTRPILERALCEGKTVALPVTLTDAKVGRMVFRRVEGYHPEELIPARFGILEPAATCPTLYPRDFQGALILVPGLAFDDQGFRVGYGGGYYDRFLASLQEAGVSVVTVGAVLSPCRTTRLPRDPHDIPVDYVIDERRITDTHGIRDEKNLCRDL